MDVAQHEHEPMALVPESDCHNRWFRMVALTSVSAFLILFD